MASSTGMPKPSVCDGMTKTSAPAVQRLARRVIHVAGEFDAPGQRRAAGARDQIGGRGGVPSREDQRRRVRPDAEQPFVGVKQHAEILARLERAEEQQAAAGRFALAPRPGGGPGRAHRDAFRRNAESRPYRRGRGPGVRDDVMRASGVDAGQRRVVAANLRASSVPDGRESPGRGWSRPAPRVDWGSSADETHGRRRTRRRPAFRRAAIPVDATGG